MILPAAYRYQGELASIARQSEGDRQEPAPGTLDTVTELVGQFEDKIGKLEASIDHHGDSDMLAEAKHFERRRCCRP